MDWDLRGNGTSPAVLRRPADEEGAQATSEGAQEAGGLMEPGVVRVEEWRPASPVEAKNQSAMWGGIARKR